jgi:hypothetical protein
MQILTLLAHTGTDRARGAIQFGILRLLKTNELRQFGDYRTLRLVLEAWYWLFGG